MERYWAYGSNWVVSTPFFMRENLDSIFLVHVKSSYAIINRYRPISFSCFLAALGNHGVVFDLRVSTCNGSFGFNNRSLSFWEHTPREYPTPIQPTGQSAGTRQRI